MPHPQMNGDPAARRPRRPVMDETMGAAPPVGYQGAPFSTGPYAQQGSQGMPAGPQQPAGYPGMDMPYPPQQPPYGPQEGPYVQQPYYGPGQEWEQPLPPQAWTGPQQPMQPTGPVMPPPDPFGETVSVDASLMKERSSRLYERKDPFWDAPDQVHRKHRAEDRQVEKRTGSHAGSHTGQRLLIMLLVLAVTCGVLYGTVFRIRTVNVEGNSALSDEDVMNWAGVRMGGSIFSLDEKAVAQGVNACHYLIFDSMRIEYPATVNITVKERRPAAVMNYCGINYILDNKGMVLSETEDVQATMGLPEVSGMELLGAYGATVGRKLNVNTPLQLNTLSTILIELRVMSAEEIVTKVKMSNLGQLLLETCDGYSVNLGDYTLVHEKIKSMLRIRDYLNDAGSKPGTIDVSDPKKPTFIPE